jgi:hypothetical protein
VLSRAQEDGALGHGLAVNELFTVDELARLGTLHVELVKLLSGSFEDRRGNLSEPRFFGLHFARVEVDGEQRERRGSIELAGLVACLDGKLESGRARSVRVGALELFGGLAVAPGLVSVAPVIERFGSGLNLLGRRRGSLFGPRIFCHTK